MPDPLDIGDHVLWLRRMAEDPLNPSGTRAAAIDAATDTVLAMNNLPMRLPYEYDDNDAPDEPGNPLRLVRHNPPALWAVCENEQAFKDHEFSFGPSLRLGDLLAYRPDAVCMDGPPMIVRLPDMKIEYVWDVPAHKWVPYGQK